MRPLTRESQPNYALLGECLSIPLISKSALPQSSSNGRRKRVKAGRKTAAGSSEYATSTTPEMKASDAEDLAEFTEVCLPLTVSMTGLDRPQ